MEQDEPAVAAFIGILCPSQQHTKNKREKSQAPTDHGHDPGHMGVQHSCQRSGGKNNYTNPGKGQIGHFT